MKPMKYIAERIA